MTLLESLATLSQLYPLPSIHNPNRVGFEYNIKLTIHDLSNRSETIENESTEEVIEAVNYFMNVKSRSLQQDLRNYLVLRDLIRKLDNKNPRPSCPI